MTGNPLDRLFRSMMPAFVAALNHVLDQHPEAAQRLRMFKGQRVCLSVDMDVRGPALPDISLGIDTDGRLTPAAAGAAGVQMIIKPSAQAAIDFLRDGVRALTPHLRIEGDVMLAATLGELVQRIRWDAEEDLSQLVGDVAAHRLGVATRGARQFAGDSLLRMQRQATGYLSSGDSPLAARAEMQALEARTRHLDERVDALENRRSS